jgi:hypothetical protein
MRGSTDIRLFEDYFSCYSKEELSIAPLECRQEHSYKWLPGVFVVEILTQLISRSIEALTITVIVREGTIQSAVCLLTREIVLTSEAIAELIAQRMQAVVCNIIRRCTRI